jgi:hypothetical protein
MPRIRCHYDACVFLEDGYCGAAAVEVDPDSGCLTFSQVDEAEIADEEEEWEEEDFEDMDEDEDDYYDDEDDEEDDEY